MRSGTEVLVCVSSSGGRVQSAAAGMCAFLLHQMLTSVGGTRKKNLSGTFLEKCHSSSFDI